MLVLVRTLRAEEVPMNCRILQDAEHKVTGARRVKTRLLCEHSFGSSVYGDTEEQFVWDQIGWRLSRTICLERMAAIWRVTLISML